MYKHCFFEKEFIWEVPKPQEGSDTLQYEINPWETTAVYCQDKVYLQYLDTVFVQNDGKEPQKLIQIPNLDIKAKQNVVFHIGCLNNDILVISDAAYLLNNNKLRSVSIYHDMKVITNLQSFQLFEFCGINILYDAHDGVLYELQSDLTTRKVNDASVSKILFFGSGLLVYQHSSVFNDDRPFNQCYMLNLLTMKEKRIARPHLDKWKPNCIHKITTFEKTGYKPNQDSLEGMLGDELAEYNQMLDAVWYKHILSQSASVANASTYSSIEKDLVSCFTVINEPC